MTHSSALSVENLGASIDHSEIVRDVSLTIRSGERILLFGPNGAGKTTLLSAIAGLPRVRITRGKILLDSEDITQLPAYSRAVKGVVLSYQIPPELTGLTVSRLAELIAKRFGSEDLVSQLAEMLDIEYLLNRDAFKGFSGGERKRVEVFFTALLKPRFALLDEPDSGVDVDSVKLIAGTLNFLAGKFNTGIVVVTHTRLLAEQIGRTARGFILREGRVVCDGDALELLSNLEEKGFEGVCNE
ncbi:MAG: ATP-binding cassette domain-containing protein [Infirmifilum sp.]